MNYDLEVHFVHKYKESDSLGAVIGVFFDMASGGSEDNPFIEEIMPYLATENMKKTMQMGETRMKELAKNSGLEWNQYRAP